jgi:hypothetical protein
MTQPKLFSESFLKKIDFFGKKSTCVKSQINYYLGQHIFIISLLLHGVTPIGVYTHRPMSESRF